MLAVLCSAPRAPVGVALLGLLIAALSLTLRSFPHIVLCCMIVLSVWVPSRPVNPEILHYPTYRHSNHVVDASDLSPPNSFELNAGLRVLIFLLAIPIASILENMLFRPARDLFLQPIEWWFEMRYVQVAQATGSWPDTWTPILNALRSYQFVADFIDSVNGNGQSPPPPMPHGRCDVDIQPSGMGSATGGHSAPPLQTRRAVQKAPSSPRNVHYERQRKPRRGHTQRHGSVIHGEVEDSSKTVFPRKTFISPPRISPSSPWVNSNSGYGTSSPISKNLSRIAGILFHYPPPRKPVLRPKFNIKTGALSTGACFERLSHSTSCDPISSLITSTCCSVNPTKASSPVESISAESIPSPVKTECPPETSQVINQTSSTQCLENVQLPHLTQVPEPPMPVPPRIELSVDDPEPPFEDAMAVEQQQLSVPMELDCPQRDMPGPLHTQALELSLPAIPSFQISQDQSITGKFAEAPQSPFTNYTQGFSSSPCPFPYASSMPQCVTAPSASSYQESMLPKEPFSAVPYPPDWPRDHQPATITTSVLQPHIAWPFQDFKATETFTFNILPDHAIPHFDFSRPSAPDATPCDDQTDFIMKDVPLDVDAPRPTSTELEPAPTLLAPKRLPETLPVSMFQQPSEVTARPSSPADSARAIAGDDDRHSDTKSSDSDSDDSDTSDSDSEYSDSEGSDSSSDDDSDSGSGSSDDDKDAATVTGPSKPKPKPGKTKVSSSPASDSQSKSQKATNVPN